MPEAAEGFWRFSLAFYARPAVAGACLELQDRQGRDVNLVLFCCWVGVAGRGRLTAADLAAAEGAIASWRQEVIETLRAARRALKAATMEGAAALYESVKAAELEAERLCQRRLAARAPPQQERMSAGERCAAAAANLSLYLGDAAAQAAASPIFAALAEVAVDGR